MKYRIVSNGAVGTGYATTSFSTQGGPISAIGFREGDMTRSVYGRSRGFEFASAGGVHNGQPADPLQRMQCSTTAPGDANTVVNQRI
jgi:hypothetical protein